MNDKELWELMSIICEGQDSEQRRKVEQYITDLQQEIERLNNIIKEQGLEDKSNYYVKGLEGSLKEYQDEVKRLNNIINELVKSWKDEIIRLNNFIQEDSSMIEINNIRKMLIQEREKDLYKLQELKGSDK